MPTTYFTADYLPGATARRIATRDAFTDYATGERIKWHVEEHRDGTYTARESREWYDSRGDRDYEWRDFTFPTLAESFAKAGIADPVEVGRAA